MKGQQIAQENEIDIRELIGVIVKNAWLISGIFIVAILITAVVNIRMPKVYEVTSTIQLGSIGGPLIKTEDAKAMILNRNLLSSVIKDLGLNIEVDQFQKDIKLSNAEGSSLIKIKIIYPGIDIALKVSDLITNLFIAQGQSVYKEKIAVINERLSELDKEIKNSEEDMARIKTLISGLPATDDVSQTDASLRMIVLQNTIFGYESNLSLLRSKKSKLKLIIIDAKDFKVFETPIKPKSPIGPKKKQNVIIAGIMSLIFGVFLSFVLEFWREDKTAGGKI